MKAVLLAGGLGTRLREETDVKPKPMVEVGGSPILWHLMKIYASYGVRDFVICAGYKSEVIKDYFMNYEWHRGDVSLKLGSRDSITVESEHAEEGWSITIAETGKTTMTGGRVKAIERYVDCDTFMVTYGDGLADIDITELLEFHKSHGKLATVTAVQPPSRFGLLNLTDDNSVTSFEEKPRLDGWVNGGFFVFQKEVFNYLGGAECVLEQDPLRNLAKDGELAAFKHEGFWYAMDTFRELTELNKLWNESPPWKTW